MSLKQENLKTFALLRQSKRLLDQPTCRRKRHKFVDTAALDLSDTTAETRNINPNLQARYFKKLSFLEYRAKKELPNSAGEGMIFRNSGFLQEKRCSIFGNRLNLRFR